VDHQDRLGGFPLQLQHAHEVLVARVQGQLQHALVEADRLVEQAGEAPN
jgi:hypothetical protein